MREKVEAQMPRLSYHFHLSPSDIWGLTESEMARYMDAAAEIEGEMQRAVQQAEAYG